MNYRPYIYIYTQSVDIHINMNNNNHNHNTGEINNLNNIVENISNTIVISINNDVNNIINDDVNDIMSNDIIIEHNFNNIINSNIESNLNEELNNNNEIVKDDDTVCEENCDTCCNEVLQEAVREDEDEDEDEDEYEDEDVNEGEREGEPETDNDGDSSIISFPINEQILNDMIENKHNEIMNWSYSNMTNVEDDVIKFIDICYLKNLQYDDEPIATLRYTIRTVFGEGLQYELKNLVSNIFSYGMIGINYLFNENFDILNELLSSELKRLLRRGMIVNMLSQMFISGVGDGFSPMEDVKLILTQEELDKIPKNLYKDLSLEFKNKNTNCPVCREEYRDNDEVRTLKCNHIFHTDCIDNWLTKHSHKCPCCRQESGTYKPNI